MAMPPTVKESTKSFGKAEGMFMIKCDVHPWMSSYAWRLHQPVLLGHRERRQVHDLGLDAGTYELEAWHEKLGVQKQTVTVTASETKTVNFSVHGSWRRAPPEDTPGRG
jgi:hypothetical protein